MGQSACGHHKYKNNKAELNKVVCKITGARHTTYTYGGNSFINVTGYELLADFSASYNYFSIAPFNFNSSLVKLLYVFLNIKNNV